MSRLPRRLWPKVLRDQPTVRAVFVGHCPVGEGARGVLRGGAMAHAHVEEGWICVESLKILRRRFVMIHELAHLTSRLGHVKRWRAEVLRLGGTLKAVPSQELGAYGKRRHRS